MLQRVAVSAWLGFALAALFFYSLAVALDTDIIYLQWQPRDVAETVAALAILSAACGVAVYKLWPRQDRRALIGLMLVAALPLASFAAGLARQLPFDDALRAMGENGTLRYGAPAAVAVLVLAGITFWPRASLATLRVVLILVSPVSLVVAESIAGSAGKTDSIISFRSERNPPPAAQGCSPVLALLFDELSFSYLYDNGRVRPDYPAIADVAAQSTNYLAASAPGPETLVSMPSLLAARHLRNIRVEGEGIFETTAGGSLVPFTAGRPEALFPTARALGFRTEMAGYYLPYCELLDGLADACQSLSFYNASLVDDRFNPLDPILTTLILWPRQFPFGVLKNPPFARLQRGLVEHTTAFAMRPMRGARPVFRFVHFSIPHLPFVFDVDGYNPPLDPLRTSPDVSYVRQLHYVDTLFGSLMDRMRADGTYDATTIVVLADHGFRFGGAEHDPLQIPFIVKQPQQKERLVNATPASGEQLLKQALIGACR
jgi:hypothetical protein